MGDVDALIFPRGVGLGFTIAATVGPISLLVIRRNYLTALARLSVRPSVNWAMPGALMWPPW